MTGSWATYIISSQPQYTGGCRESKWSLTRWQLVLESHTLSPRPPTSGSELQCPQEVSIKPSQLRCLTKANQWSQKTGMETSSQTHLYPFSFLSGFCQWPEANTYGIKRNMKKKMNLVLIPCSCTSVNSFQQIHLRNPWMMFYKLILHGFPPPAFIHLLIIHSDYTLLNLPNSSHQ